MSINEAGPPPRKAEEKEEKVALTAEEPKYPPLAETLLIMLALYMSMFLVALDRLIVATATPQITDHFHSTNDIGWYGSAYMLTASASQLVYGRLYTFYPAKWVFLFSIFVFEAGSAVCGAAPTSVALIIGRAIAGVGSGGISSGIVLIIVLIVPLRQRPAFQGFAGAIFGIASVLGPVLGGIFTTEVSWRWCFYINLPFGGAAMLAIFFLLDVPPPRNGNWSLKQKLLQLDPVGNLFLMPSVVCLILALEWGGTTYSWANWRIIFLFVLFGGLFAIFVYVEICRQEDALVPPRIFKQRSVLAGIVWTMCTSAGMMVMLYYLPIWFQAIKGVDAEKSGIMNLPLVLSMVVGSIGSGVLVSVLGYYNPFMLAAVVLMSVGAGLLTTFTPTTGHEKWIGYEFIFGLGLGLGLQQANVAVQTCLAPVDVSIGASLLVFSQQLNAAVFLAIAQTLFDNFLVDNLDGVHGIDVSTVVGAGATALRQGMVPDSKLAAVLEAYNQALTKTFILGVVMSCLALFPGLAMEWKSVKKPAGPREEISDGEKQ
ncbi:hypothetical protein UA08_05261 [Talaromyces atroroseus]|uniref:Major facilitator superfamily (MFS) profile domain-containing protein n=1 Tax=Talaromyces atroroseus TaxID=1441469 RepID=A0A225B102_TALAT|nr:hypothetical protein UA08_05261 [Talaromyces atroroseus]OKL59477.1 hypothetical protein UA08_05261 [Talaromyces atroroseus]